MIIFNYLGLLIKDFKMVIIERKVFRILFLVFLISSCSNTSNTSNVSNTAPRKDNAYQEQQSNNSKSILSRIDTYKAPPYPKTEYIKMEVYDYRIKSNSPRPDTLQDVLMCDIWLLVRVDLKRDITRITQKDIFDSFGIYLKNNANDIRGFRPWTHNHFISSLTHSERKKLASELMEHGKRTVKKCH